MRWYIRNKIILTNLSTYGITHGLVDATCLAAISAFLAKGSLEPSDAFFLVVLYNVLAFGLQVPFGFLVDIFCIPVVAAVVGCTLTGVAVLLWEIPMAAVVLAGIGNALFHIGGGVVALNLCHGKAALPGIYVAPGALGLFVGALAGRSSFFSPWIFTILLIVSIVVILHVKIPKIDYNTKTARDNRNFEVIILLLLLSIGIRSVVGLALDLPWRTHLPLGIALTTGVVFGKALGGIFADRFGWIKVSILGLLIAAPLIAFGMNYPYLAIPGIFVFNLTMPVTLVAVSNMLPGRAGFAFGLTTLALMIGALPAFTEAKAIINQPFVIFTTILLSAIVLYYGLILYSDFKRNQIDAYNVHIDIKHS